jgi:hypothetical protein
MRRFTPAGAIQQLRLKVVAHQWRELPDYARQQFRQFTRGAGSGFISRRGAANRGRSRLSRRQDRLESRSAGKNARPTSGRQCILHKSRKQTK